MKSKDPFHRFIVVLFSTILLYMSRPSAFVEAQIVESCLSKDFIANVDELTQELKLDETRRACLLTKEERANHSDLTDKCATMWDSVLCWPETSINQTIFFPCPNYIDKFNTQSKAIKKCILDPNTMLPNWSKSNYTFCRQIDPVCNDTCDIEVHINYIIIIRICGYVISMFSLFLSIVLLLRPKLRCPRNFVHINLFVAIALRTVLVMLVDWSLDTRSTASSILNAKKLNLMIQEKQHVSCKLMMTIFRYSGSVYHVAIFSEAIYLVLLLKFPYYNEDRGSKFCIIISWTLPILWMIPWILSKALLHNYWCWQTESSYTLLLKIPHSLLLIGNISCAIFIIRILYSKIQIKNLSREKIMKYRRLAKSILILIPIFGLHFIFFAWLPYASLINLHVGECFEIVSTYIETSFNAFQGMVVAFTCCFIHREVRIEMILFSCKLLKKIKCLQGLRCMSCLDSDYIRQLRYATSDNRSRRSSSIFEKRHSTVNQTLLSHNLSPSSSNALRINMHEATPNGPTAATATSCAKSPAIGAIAATPSTSSISKAAAVHHSSSKIREQLPTIKKEMSSFSLTSYASNVHSDKTPLTRNCCGCLFSENKNDFFNDADVRKQRKLIKKIQKNAKRHSTFNDTLVKFVFPNDDGTLTPLSTKSPTESPRSANGNCGNDVAVVPGSRCNTTSATSSANHNMVLFSNNLTTLV